MAAPMMVGADPDEAVRLFVRAVGASADFPAFVSNVRKISTLAGSNEARVSLLQDAIVQDVSLTAKILRIANSSFNAGGAASISSVKQAILLLGFDRVRQLSMAASVYEHLEKKSPAVKDLLVLSVLTANQSVQVCVEVGYDRMEIAYLCGLFRNLGEVLVASYRTKVYQQWLVQLANSPSLPTGAERRLLGFTFEDVGVALAELWKMPDEIIASLRALKSPSGSNPNVLHAVIQVSADLTNALHRHKNAQKPGVMARIINDHGRALGLDAETLLKSAEVAITESRATLAASNASIDTSALSSTVQSAAETHSAALERRAAARSLTPAESAESMDIDVSDNWEGDVATTESGPSAEAVHAERAERYAANPNDSEGEARAREALRDLNDLSLHGDGVDVGQATRAALRALCGAGYLRAVLALSSDDFSTVKARMGEGAGHDLLLRSLLIRPTAMGGPVGVVLQERDDVFASAESDPAKLLRRDRLLRAFEAKCCGILPLVLEDKLLGCLYFDRTDESFDASLALQALLREIRDHLVDAFARHRRRTES